MTPPALYKQLVQDEIDQTSGRLIEISDWLYENPELGCEEIEASNLLSNELKKHGFQIEKPFLDMPTAFKAKFEGRSGGPRVAILGEYDALEGVGHGCGHNIIGTSAIGSAIALIKILKELNGEVVVLGCPAEENRKGGPPGGWPCQFSKAIMCEKGVFADVDAAIMVHPTAGISRVGTSSLVAQYIDIIFKGKSAHAAIDPWSGKNALQAAVLFLSGVNAMRQQLRRGIPYVPVTHWILTEGGTAGNIIPDVARCYGGCRSQDRSYLEEMVAMVQNCAKGAALMTGCEVDFIRRRMASQEAKTPSLALVELAFKNLLELGVRTEDWRLTCRKEPEASTDFSDVTRTVPATDIMISISKEDIPWHSPFSAKATISEEGHRGLINGTKALAMTAVDMFTSPERVRDIKAGHFTDIQQYFAAIEEIGYTGTF